MGKGPTAAYHRVLNEDYVQGTLTCLKPSTIKRIVNKDFPNILNIEPTNACNLHCVYCPRKKARKGQGIMSWDLYTRIIDEAVSHQQLLMLNFHKDGESFLHPRFMDMVRYAKERNVAKVMHLNTNALCWDDRVIDEILDSGIDDITISLDAARPETYRKHKGVDCLEVVEQRVNAFFAARARRASTAPFVRVKIMEFDDISQGEIIEFHHKWEGIADAVQVTGIHDWSGAIDNLRVTDETTDGRYPCVIMWYALVINWNGEVTVCSVDWDTQINVGNVNHQNVAEIWNSPDIKAARRSQIEGNYNCYPVCSNCVVWVSIGDLREWLELRKELYT